METGVSVDDLFLKLHPCLPTDTRIGIVGGGPSGLSAAYALIKLGYSNVTVLEKHHSAGGMCESIDIEGRTYDLGGQVLAANSAPTIFHLAKEVIAEVEEMESHKFALVDSDWAYSDMRVAEDYISVIPLTLKLQDEAKATNRIGVYSVSEIASDVTPEFLKDNGLKSVPKSVAYGYTASGYGFIQDMPYAYIHEFVRTSMLGKICRFKGGYMSVWKKLSEAMPIKFLCNTEVLSIKRDASSVHVDVKHRNNGALQAMEFDKIIISGAFPFHNGRTYRSPSPKKTELFTDRIDTSTLEKDLFSKVETIEYYTSVVQIDGLEHLPMGFYYFGNFMEDPAAIGNPVAMQKYYTETNVFLFWSYGNSVDILGSEVMEFVKKSVIKMGGEVTKVILQRQFKYFPHVKSQVMKDGFYEKLENQLQGQNNTYYVGGLMAFELTERNASYAMALIRKHFANDLPIPTFPYVKRLCPLSCEGLASRQLGKAPGVSFPELSSLDSYLRHWGTLGVTENKTVYTWINEKGDVLDKRTYKELHRNAFTIAHNLLSSRKPAIRPGDKVLLVYAPGLDFIDAFFGCLRARVVPIPTIPSDPTQRGGQPLLHISNIAKICNPVAILSTFSYHVTVRVMSAKNMLFGKGKDKSSNGWPNLPWLHTDSWVKKHEHYEHNKDKVEPLSDDLCFLQFTSGSTHDPKGVMITHGGLIHNVKLMRERYKSTSETILVSWLPQYHDMGLIGGLFTCLVSGGSAVLFSPITFMKNPLVWLQIMSEYRATHSAGPNFAFELVTRRLESSKEQNFDLSSMNFLMIAAEPVRSSSLKKFVELTRRFGLSEEVMAPGYGLAENCVYVSCAYGEGLPIFVDWEGRVCCGYINRNNDDVDIKIISPENGTENDENGKEGEIWISSLSAAIGYWGLEELSQKTFENEILSTPGKKYIRTGDLGRIIDGKLFITGRTKDLIIVGGKNIYTSDIEKTVESSSQLLRPGCCAVVGIPEDVLVSKRILTQHASDQLGLVVIAEVRESKPLPYNVTDQICARVAEEHGVTIASIVAIKPRSISKTTSGKIKRYECAKRFISGTLDIIEPPMNGERERSVSLPDRIIVPPKGKIGKTDIINFLKDLLSEQTGIPVSKISTDETFVSYGVNSIGVVRAAQKISSFFGVNIGAIDIFSATCIDDLADFVESLLEKNHPMLVPTSTNSSEIKISSNGNSTFNKIIICLIQLMALGYVSLVLIIPAYISVSGFKSLILANKSLTRVTPTWLVYFISLACAPFSWILCIFLTCICTRLLGSTFLQPNYMLSPEISVGSVEFVKWWALYKAQEISSRVLAVHLRGTVFLNYWFKILGAEIASSAVIDTVDITDPSLVSIDEEAAISEGALIQSHEVKNGILRFGVVRIGKKSSIAPYAVVQKGSIVGDGAEVPALTKKVSSKTAAKIYKPLNGNKGKTTQQIMKRNHVNHNSISQLFGIYMMSYLNSLSAAIAYLIWIWLIQKPPSLHHFSFVCIAGAFHWFPYIIITFTAMFNALSLSPITFAGLVAAGYTTHGLVLSFITFMLNRLLSRKGLKTCLLHRMNVACHTRFAKLLSGTELFCVYLRMMGAKIGQHCSIRAINPVLESSLVSVGDGVHLGDFSRVVPGYHTTGGFISGRIEIQENSVIGSQGLILPGSLIENDVILGALSVAQLNSVLKRRGTFIGSENLVMVRNQTLNLDDRIEEMDIKYKKVVSSLASNLAASTLKLKSRYFHRIGVAGSGSLKLYNVLPGLPDHTIFSPGATYPVIIRHSNCLSSDDDARLDPRGVAIRILSPKRFPIPLLDLTLKTGKAFHARTIGDFATWLVCGAAAREEHVRYAPHIRDAMWGSLRRANSYTELHYYSNICRLLRFKDGKEMYVRFKLRPFDETIGEESGEVEPRGILPPETGAIQRDETDKRPLLFLAQDFQSRVSSLEKVRYVLQLQIQSVPLNESVRETVLDCTKPWDDKEFPYIDIGEIIIDQVLTETESEELEFNPFLRCNEIDVIRATSCNQSASIDHGRSLVYSICQCLRNKKPLPESWRMFLDQSDIKLDLLGCPLAAKIENNKDMPKAKATLARKWYVTLWLMSGQPFLQIILPYFLVGLVIYPPLMWLFYTHERTNIHKEWLLPMWWGGSGILAGLVCALSKWILVGKKYKGKTEPIWSKRIFMDTIWQAIRTVMGECFVEMASGSFLMGIWMRLMGSKVAFEGVYVDSMGAALNPDMVTIEENGSVGKEALLFGHIYEGGGEVKYGRISVKKGGFVGSRAVAMPGATIDCGGSLGALSLAMKEEIIK